MLRNPAYKGAAGFGKSQTANASPDRVSDILDIDPDGDVLLLLLPHLEKAQVAPEVGTGNPCGVC
jgi:hypothetical protein